MTNPPRQTILVVDDQEENRLIISKVLSMMFYDVVSADGGEQALKRLAERTPDLILLDVIMPDMDGITACRHIKAEARWTDTPVIFLSAADDKNLIVEALEVGGVDFVTKPFNKAELVTRVRTQLALKQARDQLRGLAEDKDEILGILAHDLKNTLSGMTLSAELLRTRISDLPARCVPLVENIVNATARMLAFMHEFLANQHAEQLQIKTETVNLVELARRIGASLQPVASAKDITLTTCIPKAPVSVKADPEALTQVFENLLSNAIKFTPQGGKVDFNVGRPKAGMAKCVVKDTGPGFTLEDRKRMFRRYGRLSARPTGNEPSTGLGLSIVKRLVDAMGGSITLADNTGIGSEFIVALRVTDCDSSAD